MEYKIVWRIDLEGKTPLEVAKEALKIQQDKGSEANVFEVTDENGNTVQVDLMDESVTPIKPEQKRSCPICGSENVGTPKGKKVNFKKSTTLMECFECGCVSDQSLF